jgi:hypothetical protein
MSSALDKQVPPLHERQSDTTLHVVVCGCTLRLLSGAFGSKTLLLSTLITQMAYQSLALHYDV